MSDNNKNLSNDLEGMIGDAKDGAKKTGDKISQKTSEFAEDAKEKANEFAADAKKVLSDGKNVAIIAHITLIGWIIALVMNGSNKTQLGSFYIRQVLGIMLLAIVLSLIPFINFFAWVLPLVLWVISLVGSLSGEQKPIFLLGNQFQEWFKAL
ncbi:YtxH domain-containing protein [uncultured Winogradskyella sp.]|uniref:YtxH domain-containing protein n=1 Tax=uncultured Winogradskyella sp. TaxID=395353 RepID=UPI00262A6D2D|nr:YtxH domain-containing protein [uncultured Winogradskyella sp.]